MFFFFSGNNLLLEQWTVQRLKNHSFEIPLVFSISNRGLFTTSKRAARKDLDGTYKQCNSSLQDNDRKYKLSMFKFIP